MTFNSFFSDVLSTLVGGGLLALIFFWVREKWFPLPSIDGQWHFEVRTTNTIYKPYEGMVLRYVAMLWREGNRIEGTVEKTYEDSSTGKRNFVGKNRTRGTVTGYIQQNYFRADDVVLHVIEEGHGRESTNFYKLVAQPNGSLKGQFSSMVANQIGHTEWRREPF